MFWLNFMRAVLDSFGGWDEEFNGYLTSNGGSGIYEQWTGTSYTYKEDMDFLVLE